MTCHVDGCKRVALYIIEGDLVVGFCRAHGIQRDLHREVARNMRER